MNSQKDVTVYPSLPELTFRGMFLGMLIHGVQCLLGPKSRLDVLIIHSGRRHFYGYSAHV